MIQFDYSNIFQMGWHHHRFLDSTVWTPESKPKAKRTQQTTFPRTQAYTYCFQDKIPNNHLGWLKPVVNNGIIIILGGANGSLSEWVQPWGTSPWDGRVKELPDGQLLQLNHQRFKCPEVRLKSVQFWCLRIIVWKWYVSYDIIYWGYPPPTNSEIITCSFLWRAPYKSQKFHC